MDLNDYLTLAIALASLIISGVTYGAAVRQNRAQATFELLGRIRDLQRGFSVHEGHSARSDTLAYWERQRDDVSPAAAAYMALLDALDFMGSAYRRNLVNRGMVHDALRNTLRRADLVDSESIARLRVAAQVPTVYRDLEHLIVCCRRATVIERLTFRGGLNARSSADATPPAHTEPSPAAALGTGGHPHGSSADHAPTGKEVLRP